MPKLLALALVCALSPLTVMADETRDIDAYRAEVDAWHATRVERLGAPDGWLSLVGLHWVEPGVHRVGSAADNAVVLATGPARLGELTVADDGRIAFRYDAALDRPEPDLANGRVDIDPGRSSFEIIARGERRALRVRDAQAATRTGFAGIERFPVDPRWRVQARFEPHPAGTSIDIANVIGTLDPTPNPGALVFQIDGRTHRLEALEGGPDSLFLIIADRTSGRETYGAGRFIYTARPDQSGKVTLDFNRAYNPPCAFTEFSTCPLPPPENRLDIAVSAGEKRPRPPAEQAAE
ncbi:MAG: DUF1684 domain-containing protein [Lysobacteraceae bacterium]